MRVWTRGIARALSMSWIRTFGLEAGSRGESRGTSRRPHAKLSQPTRAIEMQTTRPNRLPLAILLGLAGISAIGAIPLGSRPLRAQDAAPAVAIEDPLGIVMPRIRAALGQAGQRAVRLSFWGSGHTASDQYTGMLRERLQRRYGDGGPGAFLPSAPAAFYERRDIAFRGTSGLSGIHAVVATRTSPMGPMGMALDVRGAGSARFTVQHELDTHVRVFTRGHPGEAAGNVSLQIGRARAEREVPANTDAVLELDAHVTAEDVAELRMSRMRLFAVSMEASRGVVVDSFGVAGARGEHAVRWDDASFRSHVSALAPDVVFVELGTNEASGTRPVPEHQRSLEQLLDRLRAAAPTAPCVVIGPSNYAIQRGGAWEARPRSVEVRDAFRGAAIARGCGFFDLIALQGGPSNLEAWVTAGLALGDHEHMTDAGHERLAAALERALVGS